MGEGQLSPLEGAAAAGAGLAAGVDSDELVLDVDSDPFALVVLVLAGVFPDERLSVR